MNESRLYKAAFDSAKNSIVITDLNANILYVNKFFCETTGYKEEEAIGKKPSILKSGYHEKAFYKNMWDTLLEEKAWSGEMMNKKKNGELFWERATITPISDENGKISHYLAVKEDITHEKAIEEALTKSEKKYRDIFEKSKDPMLLIEDGVFTDCNEEAWKLLGFTQSNELIGKTPAELSPEYQSDGSKSEELANQFVSLIGKNQSMKFDWIHQKRSGQTIPIEVMLTNIAEDDSKQRIFCVWRDITERKKYEKSLKTALAEKDTLLEEVHHRVKNNLAIIIAFLQMQLTDLREDRKERLPIERAITRIYSIAEVHERLYEESNLSEIDVKKYLSHLTDHILRTMNPETNIQMNICVNQLQMNVNELTPLGMLLNELLTNSMKFAFNGRDSGQIDLHIEKVSGRFKIIYRDNGPGLGAQSITNATTSGLKIVELLLNQLEAEYQLMDEGGFGLDFSFEERERGSYSNLSQ